MSDQASESAFDIKAANKLLHLKSSAEGRGLPFTLSFNKVKRLLKQKRCFFTGAEFVTGDKDLARTIDRVDNDLGYTDANVVACIAAVNRIKDNMPIATIKILYKGIIKHEKQNQRRKK